MIGQAARFSAGLCTFLTMLLPPDALIAAEVYKWTDESGRVHYGDKPTNNNAVPLEIRKDPPSESGMEARRQKRDVLLEAFDEDRRRKKEQEAAARREAEERNKRCAKARKRLGKVVNAGFLYKKTDDPRNPRVLTEEERKVETERLHSQVEQWCR
ncbi:MAG: DUF4124 domain-containing protein [Gammaproteobacteria bacterium]